MTRLTTSAGSAAPLPIDNLDTDQIMPKQFLRDHRQGGSGRQACCMTCASTTRGAPRDDFVLNQGAYAGATRADRRREFRLRIEPRACGVGLAAIRLSGGDCAELRGDLLFERDEQPPACSCNWSATRSMP